MLQRTVRLLQGEGREHIVIRRVGGVIRGGIQDRTNGGGGGGGGDVNLFAHHSRGRAAAFFFLFPLLRYLYAYGNRREVEEGEGDTSQCSALE